MHNIAADQQKLIAYGNVLQDDNKSLKDYGIRNGDFMDVVNSKVAIYRPLKLYSPSINHLLCLNLQMLR